MREKVIRKLLQNGCTNIISPKQNHQHKKTLSFPSNGDMSKWLVRLEPSHTIVLFGGKGLVAFEVVVSS